MKIFLQPGDIEPRAVAGAQASKPDAPDRAARKTAYRDSADTSRMGRLMSENTKDITSLKSVRPDKIEAFKHFVENEPNFSDKVVDRILYKLTSS